MSQLGQNVLVAYKVEATFDTAPGDTGGTRFRLNPSPGLEMSKALITPGEVRADMLTPSSRHGSRTVQGSYSADLSIGTFDAILEAVMRSTWTAAVAITQTAMTSITTTTSTIVAAAGSWLTEGVRVGDVVRLTDHATTANNNLNLRVTAVTATTITVAGTPLTLDATPDTSFTLTILKKLANASTPTRRSFYLEQYEQDLDLSTVFGGCRFGGFTLNGGPDSMATLDVPVVGASMNTLATGTSPYYTSPTLTSTQGLTFADAVIRFNGADIATLTGFQLTYTINPQTLPIIGSSTTPDVFDNRAEVSGQLTMTREDLSMVTAFANESELELMVLLTDPSTSAPPTA